MKKLVKNAVAAAMVIAATMMNTVNAFASFDNIDTLEDGDKLAISPDGEDDFDEEATIALEDWMFEEIVVEEEKAMALEAWMFNDIEVVEEDATIALEAWMFDEIEVVEESATIALEDWMFEEIEVVEEEPIQLEDWMFEEL
ncbi:MAG: hypothetical protein MJZ66_03460 [Bacteroidales bacterium]|nr:hypothetical protein [Bacteroidales bacterium]